MIEAGDAHLTGDFNIDVCEWDGVMCFPGYSISRIPGVDNAVWLMRKE
jgi:hypothetical protein